MVSFDPDPAGSDTANAIARGLEWLRNPVFDAAKIDEELKPWLAEEMTRKQCAIFSHISDQ
jgi:predicted Zn-dependent peptidase